MMFNATKVHGCWPIEKHLKMLVFLRISFNFLYLLHTCVLTRLFICYFVETILKNFIKMQMFIVTGSHFVVLLLSLYIRISTPFIRQRYPKFLYLVDVNKWISFNIPLSHLESCNWFENCLFCSLNLFLVNYLRYR